MNTPVRENKKIKRGVYETPLYSLSIQAHNVLAPNRGTQQACDFYKGFFLTSAYNSGGVGWQRKLWQAQLRVSWNRGERPGEQ